MTNFEQALLVYGIYVISVLIVAAEIKFVVKDKVFSGRYNIELFFPAVNTFIAVMFIIAQFYKKCKKGE